MQNEKSVSDRKAKDQQNANLESNTGRLGLRIEDDTVSKDRFSLEALRKGVQ